jgi:hypothetical protein
MKQKITLLFSLLFCTFQIFAQTIVNGNFENWQTNSFENPIGAVTSNNEMLRRMALNQPPQVTKINDAHQGSFAVKLETVAMGQDTNMGYLVYGKAGNGGPQGGVPYSQKPDSITGWYKSNVAVGDSALVLVVFSLNSTPVYQNLFYFKGNHSNYTRFSFPLNLPIGFSCDTVLIGFTSSDAFTDYVPKPGSWIQFDQVAFVGTGITQQVPNADFEQWETFSFEHPQEWVAGYNDTLACQIVKTTDKYRGNYAAKLITYYVDSNQVYNTTTNGQMGNNGVTGGRPFTNSIDTLIGYYQYYPHGIDTAMVNVLLKNNGTEIGWFGIQLFATSTYTYFQIPINSMVQPDTMLVYISSSNWPVRPQNDGSYLIIDEVQLKSQPVFTSVEAYSNSFKNLIYPNPTKGLLNVEFKLETQANITIDVFDYTGKKVMENIAFNGTSGKNYYQINTQSLAKGMYTLSIRTEDKNVSFSKFIVQ